MSIITDDQAQFFLDNGYLILRGVLQGEEFRRVLAAADRITQTGIEAQTDDPDFLYGVGQKTGARVFRRAEYLIDKGDEFRVLLAHPFILRSVEKLMGPDLIPTWDSMVVKLPGEGIVVPWHRDAGPEQVGDKAIFNIDFYLDEADEDTGVWVMPGSHAWSESRVQEFLTRARFPEPGAVVARMQPGDVMFHNILLLHGSPPNYSPKLRRVIYYEFRTAHVEDAIGPHTRDYIPLKQKVLLKCLHLRRNADYIPREEEPYLYDPPAPYDTVIQTTADALPTFRHVHQDYWRS